MALDGKFIRNVIVLGHSSSGKTSLVEALLYNGGAIQVMGSVDGGNTISDYNEDEILRKISINSALTFLNKNNVKVTIIDTPGYSDFIGEAIGAINAADAALLVINAVNGFEMGTGRFYKMIKEKNIPLAIFINKMDKENADFNKCMDQINKKIGRNCACVTYPAGSAAQFKGIINLLAKEELGNLSGSDIDNAKKLSEKLAENIAESDDALLEKYLEKGELSHDEIKSAFRKSVISGTVIPVLSGSAVSNIGVKELLDVIIDAFPSPFDRPPVEAINPADKEKKISLKIKPDAPFIAQVFKTISDPYLGQISVMKIFFGRISSNANVSNATKNAKEKLGQIFILNGKKETQINDALAGDIVCAAKLKDTATGDTLTDEKSPLIIKPIVFPEPAISFSIKPKSRSDEDKISGALHKLTAEDNMFKIYRDPQTRELIASGMGDLHLMIMINRLRNRFGVQVDIGTPKVAYKETVTAQGGSQYRHKKQSGGAGQFAEVWMRVEPLQRGTGFEFVDEVVGGAIPAPFIVSCEKGVKTALESGVLAGFPVVDVRAIVYDGKTHPVDSKDIAFQIAARSAFKEACQKAKPVILEPIMDVEVIVPDEYIGDITGSLNQRRGRIMGVDPGEGIQTIKAKVPLEEMYKYVNELKSITAGTGAYTMRFSHHEVVPSNIVQTIIASTQKTSEEIKE